jgi:acyl-CoA synthetase (AMP-forming)/AMP-acid ligase II
VTVYGRAREGPDGFEPERLVLGFTTLANIDRLLASLIHMAGGLWGEGRQPVSESTLAQLFTNLAEQYGDSTAVIDADAAGNSVSFSQLNDRATSLAGGLRSLGLERGDPVALFLPNGTDWLVLLLAAARLGLIVVGVNTRYRADDLRHILALSEAKALVVPDEFLGIDYFAIVEEALSRLSNPPALIVAPHPGERWVTTHIAVTGLADLRTGEATDDQADPSDMLITFSTSGTTGLPKLALHDHGGTIIHCQAAARACDLGPGDASLLLVPLCGAFGLITALATLSAGACLVVSARFSPVESCSLIARHQVTHVNGSDDMLLAILDADTSGGVDLTTWRSGVYAEFTNVGRRVVEVADAHGNVRLSGAYGSSECLSLMAYWPGDSPIDVRARKGGTLVDDTASVRIVSGEDGRRLGIGEIGELQFRGPSVLRGYFHDDVETRASTTADGWFRSGDLGQLDGDDDRSFLYQARSGDSLRLRGFLTDPIEIEQKLLAHPSVRAAQVVGVTAPNAGDTCVAFVVPVDGAMVVEAEVVAFCEAGLAAYKVPERVIAVEAFPTVDGPNGVKVLKSELRAQAIQVLGRCEQ